MSVAIVCDWLRSYSGYERIVEQICLAYPEADVFAVVDYLPKQQREVVGNRTVATTFIKDLPGADSKGFMMYLPLMPLAVEQLDVTNYDVVISISQGVAKGVITGPNQLHISYVYSPFRRVWDMQHQYLKETDNTSGITGMIVKMGLSYLRMWDYRTANSVDYMLASSKFSAKRIKKIYGREADIIYPSVNLDSYPFYTEKEDYYMTASKLIPYKRVRSIVEAFRQLPDKKLVVIGEGPEMASLKKLATPNIELMGKQPFTVMRDKTQRAKAFIYAAEEDRDLTLVEAQACGTPVIVYGKGGACETVNGLDTEAPTGVFFKYQTDSAITSAIQTFESQEFNLAFCRQNAEKYSGDSFRENFVRYVNSRMADM